MLQATSTGNSCIIIDWDDEEPRVKKYSHIHVVSDGACVKCGATVEQIDRSVL